MALNNCENVWRVINDGVETMFMVCIRPFIPINYKNNTFNSSNFSNSSDIRSNISDINNTFVVLDNSPSSLEPGSTSSIIPSPVPNISPSSIISELVNQLFPSSSPYIVPSRVPSIAPSTSSNFDDDDTIINKNQEIIKNVSNSFNLTSNFSLSNQTNPFIKKNKDQLILVLSILIPLLFVVSSVTLYLYCKKRKSGTVIPCQTPSKKKDQFTRPKDYLLEIIPNTDIPDVEKPPPVPPRLSRPPRPPRQLRPRLMMLKDSCEDEVDEEDEVEVINVAYKVTEKKCDD